MRNLLFLAVFLFSTSPVFAQSNSEIFGNQIIVSPKGVEALPFSETPPVTTSSSSSTVAALASSEPLSESELRAISQAAGIYVPPAPVPSCLPGQACKPSTSAPEQINLRDVGPAGDISRVIEVTSTASGALDKTVVAINSSATREAAPNYWRRATQQQEPEYNLQWGFAGREIFGGANFDNAWKRTRGIASTVVAVLDTGVVRSHPEINAALRGGIDLITNPIISGDGDGADFDAGDVGDFVDLNLQNFMRTSNIICNAANSSWHGTHVAGTIAARVNKFFGAGGAPEVSILPVRVLGKCGGDDVSITDGIAWSMGLPVPGLPINPNPAQIINMSLGGRSPCTSTYKRLFAEARRRNIIVVVAAGNDNRNTLEYAPSGCPDVIAVAAHDRNGFKASFSNWGSNVAISAPGVGILSSVDFGNTIPAGPTTKELSGTSMAAPHVSAAVALLKSVRPSATFDQTLQYLRSSVIPFLSGSGCAQSEAFSTQCGAGMLDADKLLSVAGVGFSDLPTNPRPDPVGPPLENSSSGGCFIATAAFGTPLAKEVQVLRTFRDNVLLSSAIGSAFVHWYYDFSPPVADVIRHSENLRALTRAVLLPVISAVRNPTLTIALLIITFSAPVLFFWLRKYKNKTLVN